MAYSALGDSTGGLSPITAVIPSPLPSGPGQQVVMIHSQGLKLPYNLAISPVDYATVTNPTTQGYGSRLYDVSPDGTMAKALIDLRGNAIAWQFQVISPYTNQQSPAFLVTSVVGATVPFDFDQYTLESGQRTPVIVPATIILQAGAARDGSQNRVIVTGGRAASQGVAVNEPGPGMLYNRPGGTWEFVPVAALTADQLMAQFGDLLGNNPDYETDPFGLPLPSRSRVQQIGWFDLAGNPVVSPWFNAYLAHATAGSNAPRTATETTMATNAPSNSVPTPLQPVPVAGGSGGGIAISQPMNPVTQSAVSIDQGGFVVQAPTVEVHTLPVQSPSGLIEAVSPMRPLLVLGALAAVVFLLGKQK